MFLFPLLVFVELHENEARGIPLLRFRFRLINAGIFNTAAGEFTVLFSSFECPDMDIFWV